MKDKFNISEFSSSKEDEGNIISSLYNNFVKGTNSQIIFPKLIVMVIDSDVFKRIEGNIDTVNKVAKK